MLTRIKDFFSFFSIDEVDRERGECMASQAAEKARGMTDINDYKALAAVFLYYKPMQIFEIGTYLGITSDFFLTLLPESEVVSIAYRNPQWKMLGRSYNNSELSREQIGSAVPEVRRNRFTQLYGDSHKLKGPALIEQYGYFDLVFIDGDHSAKGVSMDTELARKIMKESGCICWHDANPKPKYMDVRRFLESELPFSAIATEDDYTGGIAVWSKGIEIKLESCCLGNITSVVSKS